MLVHKCPYICAKVQSCQKKKNLKNHSKAGIWKTTTLQQQFCQVYTIDDDVSQKSAEPASRLDWVLYGAKWEATLMPV